MAKAICIVLRDILKPFRGGKEGVYNIETVYLVVTVEGRKEAVEDLVNEIKQFLGHGVECAVIG